ncbi:hypothetical protein [Clostridium ganghwense]|uniref:DUF4825 domain-containing protein n=1 Tax=Clostridium ganghwense TaxID=312089 RepID=A0ABT4CTS5_9CLOT|nr:hypothetical protein [Clostridium ganghwense]MCY6371833.1 hypothetical protein [Clostridium ganghwense]
MKKLKIILMSIIMFLILGYGIFCVNINLNRQIYNSIVGDIICYGDDKKTWNLDNMQQVLNNPCRYKSKNISKDKEEGCVPKIRILFNNNPFDFRIDTHNYVFFINNNVITKFKSNIFFNNLRENTFKLIEVIKENIGILYNNTEFLLTYIQSYML